MPIHTADAQAAGDVAARLSVLTHVALLQGWRCVSTSKITQETNQPHIVLTAVQCCFSADLSVNAAVVVT